MNRLTLVLPDGLLIKLIRSLKVVAGEKQIQMEGIFGVRTVIDTIEDIAGRAVVVQRRKFGRVEEAAGTLEAKRDEVTQPGAAVTHRRVLTNRAERSIGRVEITCWLHLIQPRFRDHVHDEAALVSVLSGC